MKSFTLFAVLSSLLVLTNAQTNSRAVLDNDYDNPTRPINNVACGDQLSSRFGFTTFSSVPSFPNIGGAFAVSNASSPNCGSCWQISVPGSENPAIFFTAIDTAGDGFNLSEESLLTIAGQEGVNAGSAQVEATEVDPTLCGL